MAYRGRGKGGYGNSYHQFAKEEAYEVFPEIKEYPKVNVEQYEDITRITKWDNDLQKFWKTSPYYLEAPGQDSERNEGIRKPPLSDFIKMTVDYVPAELVSKNVRHRNKKVRWDPLSDLEKLDVFEKQEGAEGQDDDKEKKEDEDDDEDNENIEEEEDDSGDDYDQNPEFDDDEDDFNMADDGDDEGYY